MASYHVQVLLHMGESQEHENVKALHDATRAIKEKDEALKVLQARVDERDMRMADMDSSIHMWRSEVAEKDWQVCVCVFVCVCVCVCVCVRVR